jgi:hypothetical protein
MRLHWRRNEVYWSSNAIVIWKSNRTKTKIARGLVRTGKAVTTLMREISAAPTPGDKVNTLLQIPGIGLAMASAILKETQ